MADSALPTVLVVDDNDIDRQCLERALKKSSKLGTVATVANGREALEVLAKEGGNNTARNPFIILLDLNMPRMDGFEFLAELRNQSIQDYTTVFVLTTSEDNSDLVNSYKHSVAGYFVKSRMGRNFEAVATFLEHYVEINTFPTSD